MSIKNLFKDTFRKLAELWLDLKHEHRAHIAAMIMAAISLFWILWVLFVPTLGMIDSRELTIPQGRGVYAIADTLKQEKIIRSSTLFVLYVTLRGWTHTLKAGDYTIPAGSSMYDVAGQLAHGTASRDIGVVIPEGYNIWEIDRRLTETGFIGGTAFARKYYQQDGVFFPDTYRFKVGSTVDDIAIRMRENFQEKTKSQLGNIAPDALEKIITIASMLEKEASTESDMRMVAGVIQNRIKKGMTLSIDATVSYGACTRRFVLAQTGDCQVNLVAVGTEVNVDSPFNTYLRKGLPPRPIANPGLQAIGAALHPTGDYLYYLSDRTGAMHFAHTAAEHAANRRKYLGI